MAADVNAMVNATGLLLDEVYERHDTGPGHPECAARYTTVMNALHGAALVDRMTPIRQRLAMEDEILLCHTKSYWDTVQRDVRAGAEELSTGDTVLGPGSLDVALRAVGGVLEAVDAVMTGKLQRAFCAVRPPGHHARPAQGMGFCLFNNVAIAARHAQRKHGAAKVLIADWDVHHGNGTQDIFYGDGSVFFFSTHQSPWYPFTGDAGETGEGQGRACTMNRPLSAGAGMKEIGAAFLEGLIPAAQRFKPDLVLISAGFDSRIHDPLGRFRLEDDDFAELTRVMLKLAAEECQGRVVSMLEGGYNLSGLANATTAHVRALVKG